MLQLEEKDFMGYLNGLSPITGDPNYFREYDFSIYDLERPSRFRFLRVFRPRLKFKVNNVQALYHSQELLDKYLQVILDAEGIIVGVNPSNFVFDKYNANVASKDFRIFLRDVRGSIPKQVKLNCVSIALLTLSGLMDVTMGYDYIFNTLKTYGQTEFTFNMGGYLHISVNDPVFGKISYKYKSTGVFTDPDGNTQSII